MHRKTKCGGTKSIKRLLHMDLWFLVSRWKYSHTLWQLLIFGLELAQTLILPHKVGESSFHCDKSLDNFRQNLIWQHVSKNDIISGCGKNFSPLSNLPHCELTGVHFRTKFHSCFGHVVSTFSVERILFFSFFLLFLWISYRKTGRDATMKYRIYVYYTILLRKIIAHVEQFKVMLPAI